MNLPDRIAPDTFITAILLAAAGASVLFLDDLVAKPKTLFGRSMTAIEPSMFPNIVLSALVILCALFLIVRIVAANDAGETPAVSLRELPIGATFFGILTLYALAMTPLGFLISTCLAMASLSWLAGNRSPVQIALVSVICPVMLYLAATRLLAVSLPELDVIELFYARVLG